MKVLYDISVLGQGFRSNRARTGIFRVVERIAYGLSISPNVSLSLYGGPDFQRVSGCVEYLKANKGSLKNEDILFTQFLPLREIINFPPYLLNQLRDRLSKNGRKQNPNVEYILLPLKILALISDLIDNAIVSLIKNLDKPEINRWDVFHTPFHAPPDFVMNNKRLKRFFTVYDLIPILFPDFFEDDVVTLIRTNLDSLSYGDYIFCISNSTKNDLCNYHKNIDPSKVLVTHLAADPDLFYPCKNPLKLSTLRRKYNIPERPYVLTVNTLEPRKNISQVIKSFSYLVHQQKIEDLSLVLVGTKGWFYNEIFELIENDEKLGDRIIITGYVDDDDLAALYSNAMMFVYPSIYEGFGLPPLEAMQCGVPVIASNSSSLPEVVGDAGILINPLELDELCQGMYALYKQPELRMQLSNKSLYRARKFSWDKCVNEIVNAYKLALTS